MPAKTGRVSKVKTAKEKPKVVAKATEEDDGKKYLSDSEFKTLENFSDKNEMFKLEFEVMAWKEKDVQSKHSLLMYQIKNLEIERYAIKEAKDRIKVRQAKYLGSRQKFHEDIKARLELSTSNFGYNPETMEVSE